MMVYLVFSAMNAVAAPEGGSRLKMSWARFWSYASGGEMALPDGQNDPVISAACLQEQPRIGLGRDSYRPIINRKLATFRN